MKDYLFILFLSFGIQSLFGQMDQRSILEVFEENQKIETADYTWEVTLEGNTYQLEIDKEGFCLMPFVGKSEQTASIKISKDNDEILIPELSVFSLIDHHIVVDVNPKASSTCASISYFHGCCVEPALFNENCPESHDICIFGMNIISQAYYDETDSIAKSVGITFERFWFTGIPFTSKEAYLAAVRERRAE